MKLMNSWFLERKVRERVMFVIHLIGPRYPDLDNRNSISDKEKLQENI